MSIKDEWNIFLQQVYLDRHINLPDFQNLELKHAFYAGALSTLMEIDKLSNTNLKEFSKGLLDIKNEVLDHWVNMTKEEKTENK